MTPARPAATRNPRFLGPPNGRVAGPAKRRPGLSTAPAAQSPGPPRVESPGAQSFGAQSSGVQWAVVVGGIAFLLARPALGGFPAILPVLAVGYLAMLGGALLAPTRRSAPAPLGWAVPLGVGIVGVVAAGRVGGPVGDRRVGVVGGGLAVLAAVAEEALFRRLLYDRLLRFGVVAAVAGTAVGFALVHLPAYGLAAMPVDLGAALLLSWQRYASGRWTVPAVTHAVANLLAVT
jgi:membrane protease YdiL (CAAX protease family)